MKSLKTGDFSRLDYVTNKKFTLSNTSEYVSVTEASPHVETFFTESADISNGFYKSPFFYSIKQQFYTSLYKTETTQSIHNNINVIQIDPRVFDEKLKESSLILTDVTSSSIIVDDSFGNLVVSGSDLYIGNVFYEFGTIVITDTGSYTNVGLGNFSLEFRSVFRKTQLSFQATVEPNEFNYSTNPTATINGQTTLDRPRYSYDVADFSASYGEPITSSSIIPEFFGLDPSGSIDNPMTPYITTIGFFNSTDELLAIAKLASPTPKPLNFPITFRCNVDI